jgi:carboxymethylenebutenolidase
VPRRRPPLAALALVAATGASLAQDAARARLERSPRHHEWVSIPSGERSIDTFVAYPERAGKALAVLVIHENRGLTDWVRSVADRLAENGYIALAPDLLTGRAPGGGRTADFPDSDAARSAIYALDPAVVLADLGAVADHARKIPAADGRIAVIGFCWGGSQTWRLALARPDLVLAAPFYGTAPDDAEGFRTVGCPVFGFYGGADERVNATLERTAAAMKEAGKTFEPEIYEGAGHGFLRVGEAADASPANKAATEQAWKRLLDKLAGAGKG